MQQFHQGKWVRHPRKCEKVARREGWVDANHGATCSQPERCEKERSEVKGEQESVVLGLEGGEVIDTVKHKKGVN